jgi:hypothetical protein
MNGYNQNYNPNIQNNMYNNPNTNNDNNPFQELPDKPKKGIGFKKKDKPNNTPIIMNGNGNNANGQMGNIPQPDNSSIVSWLITLVLMVIPIVNIVYIIKTLLDKTAPAYKKNYIKAFIIYFVIATVLSLILTLAIGGI